MSEPVTSSDSRVRADADPLARADPVNLFDLPAGGLLRAVREAIVVIDESHRVVAINPAAQHVFRVSPGQVLGRPLDAFIPEPHRARHAEWVRRFAESEELQRRMTPGRLIHGVRANGEVFAAEATLSRLDLTDGNRRLHYLAAVLHDLTDEQALQQELSSQQQRMRAVLELAPIGIWIVDDERVAFANRAAARLFGAHRGEALRGRSLSTLLQPASRAALRLQVQRALAGESDVGPVRGELALAGSAPREVEIAIAALPDHGRTTVQMVVTDVTQRERAARELEQSRRALRQLSASVVEAREEERRRIARELHDELGQRLTALKMDLAGLASSAGLGADDPRVAAMQATLDETVASVRRIAADLRPLMLDDLGLNAAIEWLADDASRRLGIAVQADFAEIDPPLDERVAIALYRVVQEALTNVARHARARRVRITLARDGSDLVLSVDDDGTGFPDDAMHREGSYGLMGMHERVQMIGGRLELSRAPAGGARLVVRLPIPATGSGH